MALERTVKPVELTSRSTGISAQAVNSGSNYLGSEIDNSTNQDQYINLVISSEFGTAPTENDTIEIYLLYALDGTNYEYGDASTDPKKNPVAIQALAAVTSEQIMVFENISVPPAKFKILIKSEADENGEFTVLCYGHNMGAYS